MPLYRFITAVVCLLSLAGPAYPSMPNLTPKPAQATPATCTEWATQQDEDTLNIWGMTASGDYSKGEALQRLIDSCLGRPIPEIVGWGSSVGFSDSYCDRHAGEQICINYKKTSAEAGDSQADQTAMKFRKPAKVTDNWPTGGLWVPGNDNCGSGGGSDGGLLVQRKTFMWHEWGCEVQNIRRGAEGRYTVNMRCGGEGEEGGETDQLVMLSPRFMAMSIVAQRSGNDVTKPTGDWTLWQYCGIPPKDFTP